MSRHHRIVSKVEGLLEIGADLDRGEGGGSGGGGGDDGDGGDGHGGVRVADGKQSRSNGTPGEGRKRRRRTTTSGKLLGPGRIPFVSAASIAKLTDAQREVFFDRTAELSERILQLIDGSIVRSSAQMKRQDNVLHAVIADMSRNKDLPIRNQYIETSIWRHVAAFTDRCERQAEELLRKHRPPLRDDDADEAQAHTGKNDGRGDPAHGSRSRKGSLSFRDFYIGELTTNYSDALDRLREAEDMDAVKVDFFLRCLEAGMDVFSDADRHICLNLAPDHRTADPKAARAAAKVPSSTGEDDGEDSDEEERDDR